MVGFKCPILFYFIFYFFIIIFRQCHTEIERVCTKEAVTRVPEQTRVLPSRVIEVPMTQVPMTQVPMTQVPAKVDLDLDVFVRSLGKFLISKNVP